MVFFFIMIYFFKIEFDLDNKEKDKLVKIEEKLSENNTNISSQK